MPLRFPIKHRKHFIEYISENVNWSINELIKFWLSGFSFYGKYLWRNKLLWYYIIMPVSHWEDLDPYMEHEKS